MSTTIDEAKLKDMLDVTMSKRKLNKFVRLEVGTAHRCNVDETMLLNNAA